MGHALTQTASLLQFSQYILLFFGSVVEGTVAMLIGGFLVHEGTAQIIPTYISLLAGNVVIDFVWYILGRWGGRRFVLRFGSLFNATEETLDRAQSLFARHHTWILIVTKLTSGFGLAVAILTTAGMLRVPLKRYMIINGVSALLWVAMVMVVGYAFGNVLTLVPEYIQLLFLGALIVGLLFGIRWVNAKLAKGYW